MRSRCDRLYSRMHVGNNEQIKFALFTAKERFREDWAKAVVYLADAIADAYPRKNAVNHKKRPQNGPSGYRKVSKASQNYDEPVIFNNVDCSTDLWNFPMMIGGKWARKETTGCNLRETGRDRGRGGGGRGSPNARGVNATSSD